MGFAILVEVIDKLNWEVFKAEEVIVNEMQVSVTKKLLHSWESQNKVCE